MRIIVCGSIGFGGVQDIKRLYSFLVKNGFKIANHTEEKNMDYSYVRDFKNKKKLAKKIVEYDLNFIKKVDVIVVIFNKPSYGSGIEMYVAKQLKKFVILLAKKQIPTPWAVHFSNLIVTNEKELVAALRKLEAKL